MKHLFEVKKPSTKTKLDPPTWDCLCQPPISASYSKINWKWSFAELFYNQKMSENENFPNISFGKVFYWPGASFHPAKSTRNGPKLSRSPKIDDFQKILENTEKIPEAFLNKSLIKFWNIFSTLSYHNLANFADIANLFFTGF